jgi:uncharacterized protein DUF5666
MNFVPSKIVIAMLGLAAVLMSACGGNASVSPVAPSSAAGGASISGTVSGGIITTRSLAASESVFTTLDTKSGVTISVVGTGITTSPDNQGQFTLNNVPTGDVQLHITGGGSDATVTLTGVGPNDHVTISVTVNGNSAHVDSEHHNNGEISATIKSIGPAPNTFVAGNWTVTVTNSTVIRHGSTTLHFADLKVGDHVQVRGTRDGTNVTATEIKVEQGDEGEDNNDQNEGDVSGAVSGLSNSCPAITFTVNGITVTTDNTTTYGEHASCSAIQNGVKVEVQGTKQSATAILARRISLDD